MIHIIDGQSDELIGVITDNEVLSNTHKQSLENQLEQFDFECLPNFEYADKLTDRNRLIIPSEDEGYIEFIIQNVIKTNDRIEVYTTASYLDLIKAKVIYPTTITNYTATAALSFVTNQTEWRPGTVESDALRTITIDTHTNPFTMLKRVANEFDLELRFRTETNGNRVTNRYVDLLDRVGSWDGREVTFGKDLDTIERSEDTSDIYTALLCLGPEDADGNRLEVLVEDEDALQRWGRPDSITGELKHLIGIYEPQSERLDMTLSELEQYGRTELNKRINAVITYSANIVDLEHVPGMENKKIRFGDTIRIKDEKFSPPLYVEARVFEQSRDIFDNSLKEVKLGDFVEFTEEQVLAIWKQLQEQIKEKISQSQLFELTYDKPTIDGKDAQVKVDAEQDATQKAQQAESVAKDHADQVASDAESNANNYTNAVKLQIDAELLEKAGLEYVNGQLVLKANQSQVDTIESELNGAILDIADKADLAYVDGQLVLKANQSQVDGLVQDIADKADLTYVNGQLTSKADKADTYTITQVDNALNSKVSTTQYTTDINGIVTDLNDHESRITQTETDITSKVSSTQYNQDISALQGDISTLETTVGNHATSINQNASAISLKANATDVYTKTQVDTSLSNKADATTVNAIETRVSEAEAELTVQAGQIASKVSQTEYDADINGVVTRLNSAESSITQNANEISQRVTTTTYNAGMAGKEDTVYKQNSAPAHANGRLWLNTSVTPNILYRSTGSAWVKSTPTTANEVGAYSSSAGNSLASRVTTAESNITQNANAITLKASQSALDSLANDVTSVTNQVSSLQVSVNGITADVSSLESTVNGHTSDISSLNSQLTVQAGQISSKVDATFVTGAIADIEIGGRNLVINSAMNTAWTRWNSNITLQLTSYGTKIAWTSYGQSAMHSPLTTPLVEGEKYVVSFEARGTLNRLQLFIITTTSPNLNFYNSTQDLSETEFRRITVPFTYTTPRESDTLWIGGMPSATGQWLEVKKETVKLDKGNKATDWTPAPEDVQSEIDSVYSYAESEINQLAGQINLKADATTVNNINTRLSSAEVDINALEGAITSKVETSTFNTLKGRVDTAESTITQQATEIDLKVNKNGVISAINLSSEVATINASKINLVGAVTVLSDITGNLGTINAGTINGVNINGSSFKQTGTNGTITLNSNGLIFDGKNSSIEMNIITTSGWEDVSSLVFKDNNGFRAMEIYQHYTDSVLISDRALYVISGDQGLHLDGTAYRNAFNSPGVFVNGGLRVTNDKQALIVRSTNTATNAYDPVNIITPYASTQIGPRNSDYSHFNTSATLGFYFYDPVTIEGDIRLNGAGRVHNSGDGVTYIQGNTSVRATRYLSGTLTPMFASAFNTGSLASTKTDIKKLNINAIDILKNQAELYSYYLKGDIEEGISISKMGFVIGEGYKTPSEVLSADGEAVEGYAHSTLNTKAIKELIGITDDHADRINYLEMENQVLKQRLNQLEGVA